MTQPDWLLRTTILAIHSEQIAEHGGEDGIRDEGLLDSALSRPLNHFTYKDSNIFELAATYAYGIIKNHPFIDGNKRTAFVASFLFLELNGYEIEASRREEKVNIFMKLANNQMSEEELTTWFRDYHKPKQLSPA
jgi:death-on-curing protein